MFKKIISNLSFSPALVGQLGFYAKRLRKEEVTRKLGLIFTVLALLVQSLVVFQPPESANAASNNDFVRGGLNGSLSNFIGPYDNNTNNLKDILTNFGITREELVSAKYTYWTAQEKLSWGFEPSFSYAQGERKVNITNQDNQTVTSVYGRPVKLWGWGTNKIWGWQGYSAKLGGWFGIMNVCGNLTTEKLPPPPPPAKCQYSPGILASDSDCKPCPGKDTLWIKDDTCVANVIQSKSALNLSQSSVDATTVAAKANDVIKYTLTVKNTGLAPSTLTIKENLKDVSEYANITDNGGGIFDTTTKILTWPTIVLGPGEKQTRVFAVTVLSQIPATSSGQSNPTSFDCRMTNVFGNQVDVSISCPGEKIVEKVAEQLPKTGPTENMIFAGIVLAVVTYFYARTRQLKTEVRLVRRNLNTGTI